MNFFKWLLKEGRCVLRFAGLRSGRNRDVAQLCGGTACLAEDETPGKVAIRYGRGNAMLCTGNVMTKEMVRRIHQRAEEVCRVW